MWVTALSAVLVSLTIGLALQALLLPRIERDKRLERRLREISDPGLDAAAARQRSEERSRQSLDHALRELEAIQKARGTKSLRAKLSQSGLERSLREHYLRAGGTAALVLAGAVVLKLSAAVALVAALVAFYLSSHVLLAMRVDRRMRKIAAAFPAALDVVVRGIRAGLPLIECIRLSAEESADPLRAELLHFLNDLSMGLSLQESVHRFADRIPTQEAGFFATVVSIQSRSGGNLSEAIGNLSKMLREREKLQAKIRTMSSEARTSAWIIGSLPVLVGGVVFLTSHDFIAVLLDTTRGNLILLGCALWMGLGAIVMRQMIQIDL